MKSNVARIPNQDEMFHGGAEKTVRKSSNYGERSSKELKIYGVYIDSLLTKKVNLSITEIGKNIKENLQKKIANSMEGKCIEEGFIRPGSVMVTSYSSGLINREYVEFQTVFSCKICHPVEGMLMECTTKTITKAGIHAEVIDQQTVPITVFITRDHHAMDKYFQSIKENMQVVVKVIGIRYELNDPYICVIGKLIHKDATMKTTEKKKPIKIMGGFRTKRDERDECEDDEDDDDDDDEF